MTTWRSLRLVVAIAFILFILVFWMVVQSSTLYYRPVPQPPRPSHVDESGLLLHSKAYVVSLPTRLNRRREMERLRTSLFLRWKYVDASGFSDALVGRILREVGAFRSRMNVTTLPTSTVQHALQALRYPFEWPSDTLSANSYDPIAQDEIWNSSLQSVYQVNSTNTMTCALQDFDIPLLSPQIPEFLILTPNRIACWLSHAAAISEFLTSSYDNDIGIFLEDDVDMEKNITDILPVLWKALPPDWDLVMLGHCWSDEAQKPPLPLYNSTPIAHRLHPSTLPKCSHGYALSYQGARRLMKHLNHPPFAYSRAIDQAFAWLIQSNRIESYSVVPSIVVQRKIDKSDISQVKPDIWMDHLFDGVFGT